MEDGPFAVAFVAVERRHPSTAHTSPNCCRPWKDWWQTFSGKEEDAKKEIIIIIIIEGEVEKSRKFRQITFLPREILFEKKCDDAALYGRLSVNDVKRFGVGRSRSFCEASFFAVSFRRDPPSNRPFSLTILLFAFSPDIFANRATFSLHFVFLFTYFKRSFPFVLPSSVFFLTDFRIVSQHPSNFFLPNRQFNQ